MIKVKTKIPSGSLTLLTKPNAAGECAVYLRYYLGSYIKILRRSLETKASAIIIVTNRTDDVVEPETHDIEITAKISKATKLLEINLLDHVIISASSYYSIADHQAHTLTPEQLNILQEG